VPQNLEQGVVLDQPKTEKERIGAAEACSIGLDLKLPMALDDMGNTVDEAYAALPDRLYVVASNGKIEFRSEPGPWGFDVDAWEKAILMEIQKNT
jgi:hypothetical protein